MTQTLFILREMYRKLKCIVRIIFSLNITKKSCFVNWIHGFVNNYFLNIKSMAVIELNKNDSCIRVYDDQINSLQKVIFFFNMNFRNFEEKSRFDGTDKPSILFMRQNAPINKKKKSRQEIEENLIKTLLLTDQEIERSVRTRSTLNYSFLSLEKIRKMNYDIYQKIIASSNLIKNTDNNKINRNAKSRNIMFISTAFLFHVFFERFFFI